MISEKQQANNIWAIYNKKEKELDNKLLLIYYFLFLSRKTVKSLEDDKGSVSKVDFDDIKDDLLKKANKLLNEQAKHINRAIGKHLEEVYEDVFYQTALHMEKHDLTIPSKEEIKELTHAIWVGDKNFEQRTYWNIQKIYDNLKSILDSDASKEDKLTLIDKLKENYDYRIRRLIRTETMHIINIATMRVYKASNVNFVKWITCMDEKECPTCASRDEKVYLIGFYPTYPDHPNCRCLLVAVKGDNFI